MLKEQENSIYDLSIIIPVYNEEKNILTLLNKVILSINQNINYEIIIINDGSTDRTDELINVFSKEKKNNILYFKNNRNQGKSTSVIKGIKEANSKYLVIQDADLEYNPNDINLLYNEIYTKNLDVALGDRFVTGNKGLKDYVFYGNQFLTSVFNLFSLKRIKTKIGDMHSCYKMIRTDLAKQIVNGIVIKDCFALDTIILIKLTQYQINNNNLKFINIPIEYFPRSLLEGKKLKPIQDGIKCLYYILRYNLFRG